MRGAGGRGGHTPSEVGSTPAGAAALPDGDERRG